jgi:DtxR family Mn-dependent transcriptional regulator
MKKRSESVEMYLETIYRLEKEKNHAHLVEIAEEMKVTKPSVNKAINLLKGKDLIKHEHYGPVNLTDKGREIAEKLYKKHITIYNYFVDVLKLEPELANKNACRIEHYLDDEVIESMKNHKNM